MHSIIEHGAELIMDYLEVHRRIGNTVFICCFHDCILPMQNIHRLHISYTIITKKSQNLFLNNTALSYPSVQPNAILQIVLVDLVE